MANQVLQPNQFAIREGAPIAAVNDRTSLKIHGNGTIKLTVLYQVADIAKNILVSGQEIPDLHWGVFNETPPNNLLTGIITNLSLSFSQDSKGSIPQVIVKSAGLDISLTTDGQKGNHGDTFISKEIKPND